MTLLFFIQPPVIINSTEQNPSRAADQSQISQEIPCVAGKLKVLDIKLAVF
jgi:hypothetical protein